MSLRAARHAALGDRHRLAIVDLLALSDRSPTELRVELGMESNLLAHHLRVLERVGLVERRVSDGDGRRRYVRLRSWDFTGGVRPIVAGHVLFVCTHNSARSQLAAALWNVAHEPPATSAGTHPAARVHPKAVAAGAAVGLDLGAARPQSLDEVAVEPGLVVTVCDRAHEQLATMPWPNLHWSLPDPARSGRQRAFDGTVRSLQHRIRHVAPLVRPPGGLQSRPASLEDTRRARSR